MADNQTDPAVHLEATLSTFEGGLTSIPPAAGHAMIERWLNVLADHQEYQNIASTLGELRAALEDKPLDNDRLAELLTRVGSYTSAAVESADGDVRKRLERLATLLTQAGQRLSAGGPADLSGQSERGVQQPSSHHGPSPGNAGRKAQVGDVRGNADSGTPGVQKSPR